MVKKGRGIFFFFVVSVFCAIGGCGTKNSAPEKQNPAPAAPDTVVAPVPQNEPEPAAPFGTSRLPDGTIVYWEVDDLSRVPAEPHTKVLAFWYGTFTDLSPLLEYRDLEVLKITTNQNLRDISPLVSLPALKELYFMTCENLAENNELLRTVSLLTGLTSLTLECADPTLRGIGSLVNLTELRVDGHGPYGAPVDLIPIAGLTALKSLQVSAHGPYRNMNLLGSLVNLKTLYIKIYGNEEVNLGWMRDLANLEFFRLQGGRVADVRPLAALPRLKSIGFPDCAVPDILPLSGSGSLEAVYYHREFPGSDPYPEAVYEAFRARGIILAPYYDR